MLNKKIIAISICFALFNLSACQKKPEGEVIIKHEEEKQEINNTSHIQSSYLPEGWMYEDNVYYSPKMYPYRDQGSYSLILVPNTNFKYIEDYLAANSECIVAKRNITLNNEASVSYIDKCMIESPRVTLLKKDDILITGISYSKSDESSEINKILEAIE